MQELIQYFGQFLKEHDCRCNSYEIIEPGLLNNRLPNEIYNNEAWEKVNTYINKSQKYLLESNY